MRNFEIHELQSDELCTFVDSKTNTTWLFSIIEVTSRLWPVKVLGRRSYRNTELLFNETVYRGNIVSITLVTSDGFEFYEKVVRTVFGVAAIHGQVIKTRRNNRVIRVRRELKIGTKRQLALALLESEDSDTLNTNFVERMNLTLRQSLGIGRTKRLSPQLAEYADWPRAGESQIFERGRGLGHCFLARS